MTIVDEKKHGTVHFTRHVGENTGWITLVARDGRKVLGFVSNANHSAFPRIPEWCVTLDISQGGGLVGYFDSATRGCAELAKRLGGTAYEIDG